LITGLGAAFLHYLMVYVVDIAPALHRLQVELSAAEADANNLLAMELLRQMEAVRSVHNIIGASGAVAGIWMAFAYLFPNSSLYLFFFIPVKAKYLALIYFLIELGSALKFDPSDNVAHFAHLGGMLMGLALVHWVYRRDRTQFY
jgi:membrane associated rhomboid family serine protease